ncbi:MAG TPA: FHA domain-containing protein [Myxococcota bacterium]|nr:FHA domain-containing protein [Myxococcota bacterium]
MPSSTEVDPKAEPKAGAASGGTGQPIEAFRDDAKRLSAEEFERRHGSAFLLLTAVRPRTAQDTYSTHLALLDEEDGHTGALATWVYALRSSVHIVTLGRARESDVVIPDRSISRRHALLKRDGDRYLVLDADSSNGTSINGRNVLTRFAGPPTPLGPGDTLRVGSLEFTFAPVAALREMAAKLR